MMRISLRFLMTVFLIMQATYASANSCQYYRTPIADENVGGTAQSNSESIAIWFDTAAPSDPGAYDLVIIDTVADGAVSPDEWATATATPKGQNRGGNGTLYDGDANPQDGYLYTKISYLIGDTNLLDGLQPGGFAPVSLDCSPINTAPTADAGPDQSGVQSGATVNLDGSGSSDPESDALTYAWSLYSTSGPNVTLDDTTLEKPSFTAPTLLVTDDPVVLVFSLVVTDSASNVSAADDKVTITVVPPVPPANTAPTADAGPDQSGVQSGATVNLDGSGSSDPESDALTYAWSLYSTSGPNVTLDDTTLEKPSFTAPTLLVTDDPVVLVFSLVVTDSASNVSAADDKVTITVVPPGTPTADAGPDQPDVLSGATVNLDGSGSSDPESDALTYAWSLYSTSGPNVTLDDATLEMPSFSAPTLLVTDDPVVLVFSLVVTDSDSNVSAADTVTITVSAPGGASPPNAGTPTADAGPDQPDVLSGATVNLDGSGSTDPDPGQTDTLTYAWSQTSGPDVTLDDATLKMPSFTAPTLQINDPQADLVFSLVVTDSDSNVSAADTVTITVSAPVGAGDPGPSVEEIQKVISSFMLSRANNLAANQPGLTQFLQGENCGNFNAVVTDDARSLNTCLSQGKTWASLTHSRSSGSSYTLGTIGHHLLLNENLVMGGLVQFDHAKNDTDNISGSGWMIGPYFVAKHGAQPLFFEGRLLYGETNNEIAPHGKVTDKFDTERWLAQLRMTGEYKKENTTLLPFLDFTYVRGHQLTYADERARTIPGQNVHLGQVKAGLDFSTPLSVGTGDFELIGGLSAIYSSTGGSLQSLGSPNYEGGRARATLGFNYELKENNLLSVSTFYDGIGANGYSAHGASLHWEMQF